MHGWVDSSRQAIEFTMDPRNFLHAERVLQFKSLSYDGSATVEGIERILRGTDFYRRIVEFRNSEGQHIQTDRTYAELLYEAGRTSRVNPYHLASRMRIEVGPHLLHPSISGIVPGYEGLFNFYNIGATSEPIFMDVIRNGLRFARRTEGRGINNEELLIPWNTKERAMTGGAIFIGSRYINVGQNTIYLQKFDVNPERGYPLFWHQYMTSLLAPGSEARILYNAYRDIGLLDEAIHLIIPVFENMPEIKVESPNIDPEDFKEDSGVMRVISVRKSKC